MKLRLSALASLVALPLFSASPAAAQGGASAPVHAQSPPPEDERSAPAARTGFQMALRTGVMIPFGDVDKSIAMGDAFSPQVPLVVELGGKIIPHLFLGGFFGVGVGGVAGKFADACKAANASCVAASVQLGVELQVHVLPAEKLDPWVGYGIGYSANGGGGSANGKDFTVSTGGLDFAHLMAGLDIRLSRAIGLGPVVDFTAGTYTRLKSEVNGTTQFDGDVKDTATHYWLTIGGRLVLFP